MEKNSGSKILIVVLLIACLGLGGFIVYDKVINKDSNCPKEENVVTNCTDKQVTETTTNNNENTKEKTRNNQILITKPGKIIVDKSGDAYLILDENYNNYNKIQNATGMGKIGKYGEYKVDGYRNRMSMDDTEEDMSTFTGYKLDLSNIVSAYYVEIGQSDYHQTYLFVKEDGTVDMLAFEIGTSAKAILEKNVSKQANIVSVTQSATFDSRIAQLVDKEGNTYDFDNYEYFK